MGSEYSLCKRGTDTTDCGCQRGPIPNYRSSCYSSCGNKGGLCPQFCGNSGACCRQGRDWDLPECQTYEACSTYHCCVRTYKNASSGLVWPPPPPRSPPPSLSLLPLAPVPSGDLLCSDSCVYSNDAACDGTGINEREDLLRCTSSVFEHSPASSSAHCGLASVHRWRCWI